MRRDPQPILGFRSFVTSSPLARDPEVQKLRPFDIPAQNANQEAFGAIKMKDPESRNYHEIRKHRLSIPRKRIDKFLYSSITKALYSRLLNMNDVFEKYLSLPMPRPLHLQFAELEQLLSVLMSPIHRDRLTIKRLLQISEDMRGCALPLSIKEINTLVYLVLRDKGWQSQYNPAHPTPPSPQDMDAMLALLSQGMGKWPVSTFNIALDYCKNDEASFAVLLDRMKEEGVPFDSVTYQAILKHRLRFVESGDDCLPIFLELLRGGMALQSQHINILLWGLLRKGNYEQAESVVFHLSQYTTNDISNSVRQQRDLFRAKKLSLKKLSRGMAPHPQRAAFKGLDDIPPTPLTDSSFSMLIKHQTTHATFQKCFALLEKSCEYFGELPSRCVHDMYNGFSPTHLSKNNDSTKRSKWTEEHLYSLAAYVLESDIDHSVFNSDIFMSALSAYKQTHVLERRGRAALVVEARCLDACRLARSKSEERSYIFIYLKRLHLLHGGHAESDEFMMT